MSRTRLFSAALAGVLVLVMAPATSLAGPLDASGLRWRRLTPAPAPSWYTPEFHRRVAAAGPRGLPIPSSAGIPVSSLGFLGIRPGQLIFVGDGMCTSNFVFR